MNNTTKEALEQSKLAIEAMIEEESCGDTFIAYALTLDKINLALSIEGEVNETV